MMKMQARRADAAGRAPRRPAAANPFPFIAAALFCAGALAATYLFFVGTSVGQLMDEAALREAELNQTRISVGLQEFLDRLPLLSVVLAAAVIVFVTLARRRWTAAVVATTAMAAANLTTQLLKDILERPELGVHTLATNSLPSGHATLAASSAAAVFLVVSPRWRPMAAAAGGTYSVAAGAATLINLWHRPSDILAAFLVVALFTSLAGWIVMRAGTVWNVWDGFGEHWAAAGFWPGLTALVGGVAAGVAALFAAAGSPSLMTPANADRLPLLYGAGLAAIVAAGYLLCAAGILLFSRAARTRR